MKFLKFIEKLSKTLTFGLLLAIKTYEGYENWRLLKTGNENFGYQFLDLRLLLLHQMTELTLELN
jgi:hypothetical protein